MTLALLRAIITEGTVYYDGIATDTLNLDALRSNVTIIPQVVSSIKLTYNIIHTNSFVQPELLSGSLRHNLDPLSEQDDAVLNGALRAEINIKNFQKRMRVFKEVSVEFIARGTCPSPTSTSTADPPTYPSSNVVYDVCYIQPRR